MRKAKANFCYVNPVKIFFNIYVHVHTYMYMYMYMYIQVYAFIVMYIE